MSVTSCSSEHAAITTQGKGGARALLRAWQRLRLVLVLLVLVGCSRSGRDATDVQVDLAVAPEPPVVGMASVTVALHDAGDQPISGAQVELEGTMTHAGMAPVFSRAREVAPGQYKTTIDFTMVGDWFVIVHATLPDGRKLDRQVDVGRVYAR